MHCIDIQPTITGGDIVHSKAWYCWLFNRNIVMMFKL